MEVNILTPPGWYTCKKEGRNTEVCMAYCAENPSEQECTPLTTTTTDGDDDAAPNDDDTTTNPIDPDKGDDADGNGSKEDGEP